MAQHGFARSSHWTLVGVRGLGGRTYLDKAANGGKELQVSDVALPSFTDRVSCAICNEGSIAGVPKPIEIVVATASIDHTARLWSIETGEIAEIETGSDKIVITGHNDWLRCAAFSPDSLKVVTASGDGKAKTWSAVTGKPLLDLAGHADWLRMAAFSVDGGLIVTASKDGTAKVWRADNGECIRTLDGHKAWVRWAAFSPGQNRSLKDIWSSR
ncbi:Uncharacterized WD repeat-containing protein alr2800 [Durusdinium trenchii]|uniref:Uncharacterized WD repeat-containing protein alr2800 n=1 Tax=Durusdinium trenchii TaxID=1381693 RepID=A0ABP0HW11_9DINO